MKKKIIIVYVILILIVIKLPSTFFVITHYNHGNDLYQKGDYDGAIKSYTKALKWNPPENKECSIRINLVLAMLAKIDENDDVQNIIKELKEAREVLCENGCANENDNLGHSDKAEQLKSDIDDMLNQLQNNEIDEDSQDETEDEQEDEVKENLDKLKEQLEEIQKESREARQEEMDFIRSSTDYEYYSGKRW